MWIGLSQGYKLIQPWRSFHALEPPSKALEGPLCRNVVVECSGSVASHFRPSLFVVFLGGFLFIFLEVLHGTYLIKNLTSVRSFLCEEKSVGPFAWNVKKMQKLGEAWWPSLIVSWRPPFLHLDIEPTQIVDVLGMSCCFSFAIYQVKWSRSSGGHHCVRAFPFGLELSCIGRIGLPF